MRLFQSTPIHVFDRQTKQKVEEKVYGGRIIKFLYGNSLIMAPFRWLIAHLPFLSAFFGWLQTLPRSQKKIDPFIRKYHLNRDEFLEPSFAHFDAFFSRKLKPSARPISQADFCMPADGRYLLYPDYSKVEGLFVKGKKFSLETLLQDKELAQQYEQGSVVIGRLCPSDYHRNHSPAAGEFGESRLINGPLYSVNPAALKWNIHILGENKRVITPLTTPHGVIQYIEVGATFVGSIEQTYTPGKPVQKGEEKSCFHFGGSTVILLFPPGMISFDEDLLEGMESGLEVRCLMGQSLGKRITGSTR